MIDENCLKKYNQVFLFLLTVKRAKWSLDELRFTGKDYTADYTQIVMKTHTPLSWTDRKIKIIYNFVDLLQSSILQFAVLRIALPRCSVLCCSVPGRAVPCHDMPCRALFGFFFKVNMLLFFLLFSRSFW